MTSGGNSLNDFLENQLTIDFAFFQAYFGERYCITVPPCTDIIWGTVPQKIFGGTAFPSTTPLLWSSAGQDGNREGNVWRV